jgi:hypothetical protein
LKLKTNCLLGWVAVPEETAREKISSAFRTRARRQEEQTRLSAIEDNVHHQQKKTKR